MTSRLRLAARRFEGDPKVQYHWHKWTSRFWLANFPLVIVVFFFAPAVWTKVSVLYLILISIYAVWDTALGAMAASEAAADEPVSAHRIDEADSP